MKNMKTWLYVIVGLMVWLNWDKISGMLKKKDETTTPTE
jgi:hypothetical protein